MDQLVNDARVRSLPAIADEDVGKKAGVRPVDDAAGASDILGSRPPSRPERRFRVVVFVGVVLTVFFAAWSGNRYLVPHAERQFVVKPVDLAIELTGPGTLDATRMSTISSRFQGVIAAMHVDRNDRVRRGDVIAVLATDDLKSELAAARASADAARTAVDLTKADRTHAEAALTHAQQNFERQKTLLGKGVASKEANDTAVSALRQAEADFERSQAAIKQAQAQETSAIASAEVRRVKLHEGTIRAPFDGVVVSRDHYVGDTITPGTEIIQLVDTASIILSARFDESSIYRLSPGQKAIIRFSGGGKEASTMATVLRIGRQVDTETREFSVDLRPETLPPNWALGQRAMTTIEIDTRKGVLAVPAGAIERRRGKPGVWIVDRGRAYWIAITLGESGGQSVEVTQGLEPGDIILNEPREVYYGMRVVEGGAKR